VKAPRRSPAPPALTCFTCGAALPPQTGGRPRRFCSGRCCKAASRARGAAWTAPPPAPPEAEPLEAFLVGRAANPDDQVLAAVHETLLLVISYRRLGVEARRQFAWRCAGMADDLEAALQRYFREVAR
jgi:hypothetical protein